MDKLSKLFFNQVSILQKSLEHLLEKKPLKESKEPVESKPPFQASTDLSQIDSLGMGLPSDTVNRTLLVFSRLAHYFDSGLLFQQVLATTDGAAPATGVSAASWKTIAGFDSGDFFPLKGSELSVPFQFPQMNLIEVRKVHSPEIFSHLQKIQVIRNQNSDALIFKPHPDFIFMVTSTLGDPWLKTHIERIQREVLLLLVDQF